MPVQDLKTVNSEQHTKEEKAKFLSKEYGYGGSYSGSEDFETIPGKGIFMRHNDKENPENNIIVHLSYKEAADMIDFLIQNDRFITQKDIEERQQRAIYYLKNYDPNNPLEAPQIEKAKAILDSYNIDYSQLLTNQPEVETATPEQVEEMNASIPDDAEIPDINAPAVPIEQEETVYSESAVVAEFRNKTTESFHLIGDRTEFDIELEVEELLRQEMIDNEIAGDIEAVVLYGSRSRGLETSEDTDIDIVVQINNAELKENALFNIFNGLEIEIDGIPVDVNPIRPEETGTLEEYLPKAEAYLEQKQAEKAEQVLSSSVGEQAQVGLEVPDDSTEQVQTINPDDIKIGDRFEYNGEEYTVRALQGNQPDTVKVSYMAKQSHNLTEYEVITNIDKYVLAEQGAYLGNDEYVIDDPAITIEKYNYTIDFNRIAEIRFTRETETYLGGLDSDGHERKDNFGVSEEDTSFYLSDGYLMKYESDYGDFFPVTKESAAEDIEEFIHKALTTPDMSIRITDREGNISYLDRESFTITDEAEMSLETPDENEALIEEAKKRISDFVAAEYDGDSANFSDLSNIGIAYTTTEDGEHEIQATVDLINTSIVKRVDGGVISLTKYETLADLVDALNDLDFADLTYISDEQLQQINERGNSDYDLKITSVAVNIEPQVIEDRITVEIGLSESPIIDDLNERIANSTEPLTFAAVNAAFEYLDQKQHLERLNPLLKAGWYKKTDFTIKAVIDGEEYSYSGRFDIGDGKGTGGGSLIDHISDFINYTLAPTNPYHLSDDELAEQQKVKDIVIPFLREHEELTQADQFFVNRLKHIYPTRVLEEQYQSLVGKTVDYNGRQYVVDRVDIGRNKAHIRDDNTGWYPLFQDVELRDIVGQNIDLILDEKEQFFRDCDLPALLAKSSLAWDEIESLGYIFYEQGYIDRVRPTDAAHFGNGYFAETEAFELARRYQNGEDVSRELAERLFLHKNKNAPLTSIPFEDSYVEDLELDIRQTDTGLFVSYGAYSREVSFEEIGRAYLNYFAVENEAIRKEAEREETEIAARKALKELGYEFDINGDKFFFTETGVERMYYVLDGTESGHFVVSNVSYEYILRADDDVKSINDRAENALNLKATTVKVKVEVDGKEKYVVDATKTAQARAKQELIMQKFKEWIFADKSRRDDLVETYNRQFNSSRPREYDGSHLNFVGMNPEITLRQHQLNAVARCLYGGNTLLAHEVGAGKTFEMIAAAMEGKRLGLHSKSLICVPNHLTEQIGSDFIKLYPNANILVATKKDFEKENRRALMAKIATGNYDAIIIGHSQLEKIPISQERQQQYIREQIEETMRNIEELKAMNGERYQIKQAEKTKANLEAKLQKLLDSPKDDTVTFEELGIDKLFVDEAHLFKNLFLATKMQNVSGISTSSDVQKTADLFMKTKYMDEITGGKGIVFATGTPYATPSQQLQTA